MSFTIAAFFILFIFLLNVFIILDNGIVKGTCFLLLLVLIVLIPLSYCKIFTPDQYLENPASIPLEKIVKTKTDTTDLAPFKNSTYCLKIDEINDNYSYSYLDVEKSHIEGIKDKENFMECIIYTIPVYVIEDDDYLSNPTVEKRTVRLKGWFWFYGRQKITCYIIRVAPEHIKYIN